jgi:hypothetical protein
VGGAVGAAGAQEVLITSSISKKREYLFILPPGVAEVISQFLDDRQVVKN